MNVMQFDVNIKRNNKYCASQYPASEINELH